ncbi:MAG: protein kinase [Deltaproteobacteria bacterium]|nr:protein kinase [Deltaproteobacteria bacterium]
MEFLGTAQNPQRYRIERTLGRGASGEVLLGYDTEKDIQLAIKVLSRSAFGNSSLGKAKIIRFFNEFNALKHCTHKSVIQVYDFYELPDSVYFTMEYCEGSSLADLVAATAEPIDTMRCIKILYQIVEAMSAAHDCGITHRDLKPANVFIAADDSVKLLDFGIAKLESSELKLTESESSVGTLHYMPPESFNNGPVDKVSDIYSFGVLAFELLTKELPFNTSSIFSLPYHHMLEQIPSAKAKNPRVPDWLDGLIITCLQKEKDSRYQSMLELVAVFSTHCPELHVDAALARQLESIDFQGVLSRYEDNLRTARHSDIKASLKRVAFVFLVCLIAVVVWWSPLGTYSNITLLRSLFFLRGPIHPPADIVIVALDNLTYEHLGLSTRQPFPRTYWAQALEKIHATQPKVVIVDGYIQPDNADPAANTALEKTIKKGKTVLFTWEEDNLTIAATKRSGDNAVKFHNDPRFSKAAFMEITPWFELDNKSIVARIASRKAATDPGTNVPLWKLLTQITNSTLAIPTPRDYINFYGDASSIKTISMYDVISNNYDFKDKIVLMGLMSTARNDIPGSFDLFSTTGEFFNRYFGVEIHATIAANILDNTFIRRLPPVVELGLILIPTGLLMLFLIRKTPRYAVSCMSAVITLWLIATIIAFNYYLLFIPGVLFMFFFSIILCAFIWYAYGNEKNNNIKQIQHITGIELD